MSYLWTPRQWYSHYLWCRNGIRKLFFFNILAFAGLATWWYLSESSAKTSAIEQAFLLSGVVIAINFALCYAALAEIDNGFFAGISCSGMIAFPLLGAATYDGTGLDPRAWMLAGLAVTVASSFYACRYFNLRLLALLHGTSNKGLN